MRQGGGELALDLVGQFAGISQRERRIDGQRHLRVEPMTEAPRRELHSADALGVLGPRGAAEMAGELKNRRLILGIGGRWAEPSRASGTCRYFVSAFASRATAGSIAVPANAV